MILTETQMVALTETLREAHESGYSLDDPDLPRWLASVVADMISVAHRDTRARVEAAIAPWPPGARKGDVLRALGDE